jgi:hypothetical protein
LNQQLLVVLDGLLKRVATGDRSADKRIMSSRSGTAQRVTFSVLLALAGVSLFAAGAFIREHLLYRDSVTESARAQLVSLTVTAAKSIDTVLVDASNVVDRLAGDLSAGRATHAEALERLRKMVADRSNASGGTVTYRPFGFDPHRRLYSAYFVRKNGVLEFVELDKVQDYTRPEVEWYGAPMERGPLWTEPYWDEVAATYMVTYSAPFHEPAGGAGNARRLGVVTMDITLDGIRRIVETLNLGASGFGALVSAKGLYLHHPNTNFVVERRTLAEIARASGDRVRAALSEKIARRESGLMEHTSTTTGLASWLVFAPVPSTGWSLQNTFVKDDLPLRADLLRHQLIHLVIASILFLCAAAALVTRAYTGRTDRLWMLAAVTSVVLVSAVSVFWTLALKHDPVRQAPGVKVSDTASLRHLMEDYRRRCEERRTEPPLFVPTGVYIESAFFGGANELTLSGFLWQKYTLGLHDHLARGFVISGASKTDATENLRIKNRDTEVVRWQFVVTLHVRPDHSRYPLEQNVLGIRIAHRDLNHNVVLVPDLTAYKLTNPASLPGLDKDLYLTGWAVEQSYFELRQKPSGANFGFERGISKEDFPSLYFNMVVKRVFVDAFISNLTPLIIISILLFTLIMIASRDERLVGFMQAGSGRILNICAAMFFVIAFSHIDIRRKIGAEEIFYLECFYFLTYVNILWVSVNSVLFAMGREVRLIQFRNNLLAKILYWPVLLGAVFAVTLVFFY